MISRWRTQLLLVLLAASLLSAEETPPGLVPSNSEQDLVAEASHSGNSAQKREASLSNSYGEPLPPDAYGPPQDLNIIVSDLQAPPQGYAPDLQIFQNQPPGTYGPPAPVNFPSQAYHGPPPPYSKPKPIYGPPKQYGPPKPTYGPPKISYPKPILPPPKKNYFPLKQNYGPPSKPLKLTYQKPIFSSSKPAYIPPKPIYGPPQINFGSSAVISPPAPLPLIIPAMEIPNLEQNNIDTPPPAPIYGSPANSLPPNLKPNYPLPSDTYGPPGYAIGVPLGPEQLVHDNSANQGHYGPPQPDPNPKPPHPGIPAPPTPPHVLYDGWKPIPGVSVPTQDNSHAEVHEEAKINLNQHLPNVESLQQFSQGAHISSGYSNVHQDALSNIDLNAIVGGDSNAIDQSKTVFEAHYTENLNHNHGDQVGFSLIQGYEQKPADNYGPPPPVEPFTRNPHPASLRQQGAKGLVSPSGYYGVPVGSEYGAPPRNNHNLPLPYGYHSGGGHSGLNSPQKPVKFRDSVPEGLLSSISQNTQHKDFHGIDHITQGPTYLPPPIQDVKDISVQTGNAGINSLSLSIEPTNLYSLPHSGNPISFQQQQVPSNLYGSPIDSYSAPLLTVHSGDHVTAGSTTNQVTATVDGTVLANLSNLDAAAILKHCPYHEAILKAAQTGKKIPADIYATYMTSLNSLGNTLNQSANNTAKSYILHKDLETSHTNKVINTGNRSGYNGAGHSNQKAKSTKGENSIKSERLKLVSDEIQKTSERIQDLDKRAKLLQQKIIENSLNFNRDVTLPNKIDTYSIQIQGSHNQNGKNVGAHDNIISEGLLQSILQAVEGSSNEVGSQQQYKPQLSLRQQTQNIQSQLYSQALPHAKYQNFLSNPHLDSDGITLPAGYEPYDHSKDQSVQPSNRVVVTPKPCDLKIDGSEKNEVVVSPPKMKEKDDSENEVSIYFNVKDEPVTEISVATSISEEESN